MRYRYSKKQYWYFKVLWKVYVVNSAWFRSVIYTWLHSYQIAYHTPDFFFLKETDEASSWTPVCSSQLKFEKLSKKHSSFKNQPKQTVASIKQMHTEQDKYILKRVTVVLCLKYMFVQYKFIILLQCFEVFLISGAFCIFKIHDEISCLCAKYFSFQKRE